MVVVLARERLRVENGGVKLLIRGESGLGIFQVPFRDPRVFFSGVPFSSDQKGAGGWRSAVADDLFNFVFFFPVDKVRGWRWDVLAMDLVFTIRR